MSDGRPERIEDYALLGDCRSAALVSLDGSIDWLCMPRFDSPAFFAALVGTRENGHWSLAPIDAATTRRRYETDSMVLCTTHETPGGTVDVVDALDPTGDAHRLVRVVRGTRGRVRMRTELRIRCDYGAVIPWVHRVGDDLTAVAGPDGIVLRTPVPVRGEGMASVAEFEVAAGETIGFELVWHPSSEPAPGPADPVTVIDDTLMWWRDWARRLTYTGRYHDDVRASLLVLKALSHAPTGAIVAAPTTSLPEWPGGTRNWDYRYTWLRDATFTLLALVQAGCVEEATRWRDWLVRTVAGEPSRLQIMYGVAGERRLPEFELDWLDGFGGSRPVRIGNGAHQQLQLDVIGELMDAMHQVRLHGIEPDPVAWNIQRVLLDWLEDNWERPDDGIWEVRSGRRHFTYSKVMSWVAFDRGVRAVEEHGLPGEATRWAQVRDRIHAEVCDRAVSGRVFTQSYGSASLDASTLMIPLVGFLPPDDPRVVATVEAVQRELTVDGLVQRYRAEASDDGVGGEEGAFLLCSFWLVDALILIGREDEAVHLYERLLSLRNDVGLLSEEYDPVGARQLGNVPQAFSHVGLVGSAMMLCPRHTGPSQHRSGCTPP